ncbi:MAG: ABC transporter permease [Candidatus Methylacidiphilales bacterium]|nr:ABC transporter permease [Candidatus Methylacidiphilales bacterium]
MSERSFPGLRLLALPLAFLAVFFAIPFGIIAVASFMSRGNPLEWTPDLSAYGRVMDPLLIKVFFRSVFIASGATASCLAFGFPLAWFIVRQPPSRRRFLYFLVMIPLTANSLVLTYSWIAILRQQGFMDRFLQSLGWFGEGPFVLLYSTPAVFLGLTYWYLPFMVYPIYASLEKLDFTLAAAAADLGAGRWETLRRIILPLAAPGILTGCTLVFIQTFCSFVVPDMLGGGKVDMIGNIIQKRFLSLPQDWPLGAALSMALLALIGGALFLSFQLTRETPARRS